MRVSSLSDLHLEFCTAPVLPGGDILLMAGDIFSAIALVPQRTDANSRAAQKRAAKFADEELSKYQTVFYVIGNHEHYGGRFDETVPLLRFWLKQHAPHVTLLDNERADIKGIAIMGTTLWARCGAGTAEEWSIHEGMRDFTAIRTTRPLPPETEPSTARRRFDDGTRRFLPADAARINLEAIEWLHRETPADRPVILFTHHAPSYHSGHGAEYAGPNMDDAYCCNLVDFLLDRPNIKLAVHGHTHHPEHYRVGETLVVSNPRGYFPQESVSRHFDPSREDLDLEELK